MARQRGLVLEREQRLEQEHDVEGAGREGWDLRDGEATREVARALAGDGDGACAGVNSLIDAAQFAREEPPWPGDATAQVQHRDPGADAGLHAQSPDLSRGHEAL